MTKQKITVTMTMFDAGYSSLKPLKDAYIAHMRTMPYTVVKMKNGKTFAYGSEYAYMPCDTRHKIINGIKKLLFGTPVTQMQQYNEYTACDACGCTDIALCHTMPKSHGGTPCVNNITVDCSNCNGKFSNQVLHSEVVAYLMKKTVTFTYELQTID